jgi:RNA polymerase sigma factor (sigma-70 family)
LQQKQIYTDSALIVALQNKESTAFEYLYQNYKGALFTVIHQIIPDKDDAGDVLQEAFTTIWKNIDKYDASKGRLFTWMFNVSRNCAINTTRSKNYKSQQKNDSIDNYVNYTGNAETASININTIGLRKQVQLLREEYRKVLELSYFTGLTHDEIAATLNIPVGTVKTRIRNAIIELRKHFV